jgi:hypothetical protein
MTPEEMKELSQHFGAVITPGALVVFLVKPEHMSFMQQRLTALQHKLAQHNITILALNEDVSFVVVPEARRILTLPREIPS